MYKNKNLCKTIITVNIETNFDEVKNIENYISDIIRNDKILKNNNKEFGLNKTIFGQKSKNIEFITLNKETKVYADITEKEFLRIVGVVKNKSYRNEGYQKSLYSNYLKAKSENDTGYIKDVFEKAIQLKKDINTVKRLMKNEKYMKEWKRNMGRISPLKEVKRTGSLKKINLIKNLI